MAESADQPEASPYGATGPALRLWRAKEAVRQGELILAGQQNNILTMEARATAIFGWSVPIILAFGTLFATSKYCITSTFGIASLACSSVLAAQALWPKDWGMSGTMPTIIMDDDLDTEMESLESFALSYDQTIRDNELTLSEFARRLRLAWTCFISTPVLAALGLGLDHLILS